MEYLKIRWLYTAICHRLCARQKYGGSLSVICKGPFCGVFINHHSMLPNLYTKFTVAKMANVGLK